MVHAKAVDPVHRDLVPRKSGNLGIVDEESHLVRVRLDGEDVLRRGPVSAIRPSQNGLVAGPGMDRGSRGALAALDDELAPVADEEVGVFDVVAVQVAPAGEEAERLAHHPPGFEEEDLHLDAVLARRLHLRAPVDRGGSRGYVPSGGHRHEHLQLVLRSAGLVEADLPALRTLEVLGGKGGGGEG